MIIKYSNINVLLLLFFLHGFLYFLFPSEINDNHSLIKYLKYMILVFMFFYVWNINFFTYILLSLFLIFLILQYQFIDSNEQLRLFQFIIPFGFMFLFTKKIIVKGNLHQIAVLIYVFSTLLAFSEYFIFNGLFSKFGVGSFGYRISSIFVNPNNFGITLLFITIYIIEAKRISKLFIKLIYIVTSGVLYLTFSKTAIILFLLYLVYKFKIISMIVFLSVVLLLLFYFEIDSRLFESYMIRQEYNNVFIDSLKYNFYFPFTYKIFYTDNVYYQIWGYFGFFTFLLFMLFNFIIFMLLIQMRLVVASYILMLFLVSGITTNILYIWPIAYMYWGYVFYFFTKIKSKYA